jgi:hypothetical protein
MAGVVVIVVVPRITAQSSYFSTPAMLRATTGFMERIKGCKLHKNQYSPEITPVVDNMAIADPL